MTPEQLHDRLQELREGRAPLPMTPGQADRQALRLRVAGMSYSQIAVVMSAYHGVSLREGTWRIHLRELGAPASPRGDQSQLRKGALR